MKKLKRLVLTLTLCVVTLGSVAPVSLSAPAPVDQASHMEMELANPWVAYVNGDLIYVYYQDGLLKIYQWNPQTGRYELKWIGAWDNGVV